MSTTNWGEMIAAAQSGFDPVPDGNYEVEVIEATPKQTNDKSKTMFAVKFNITSGPHKGRKVWNNFTVSPENPNALGFFFKHMAALGLPREWFQSNPSDDAIAQALLGRTATLVVGHREFGGQVRNQVSDVIAPATAVPGAPAGAPPVSAAAGFAAPPPVVAAPAPVVAAPAPIAAPPPIPQPAPVAPVAPPTPAPVAAPPVAAPPVAAPPVAAPPVATPAADVPAGFDPAAYQAFLAFQASQQAAQNGGAPATPQPQPPF